MDVAKAQAEPSKRDVTKALDLLELRMAELKTSYEQYFLDVQPLAPDGLHKEVTALIRSLLRAPFKNSATRFRLQTLISRYQAYNTYWSRVLKQREAGTYSRDVFKARIRSAPMTQNSKNGAASGSGAGIRQLYEAYLNAIKKTGGNPEKIQFEKFKSSVLAQGKKLKSEKGIKKVQYKVVISNGKVCLKASAKK